MDVFTQGVAGALLAQLGAKAQFKRHATVAGFAAGLLPDADALIRSSSDPLLTLEFHRQFSHSFLFIPIGALIATLVLLPFMRRTVPPQWLYLFCLLGYSSGGILDACTSFGTQLLWPFSEERIAWNLISIVDPVFTLTIFSMVIAGWWLKRHRYAGMGLAFACMYLFLSFTQQQIALQIQQEIAQSRNHQIERSVIKPTMGNIILWRSVYQYNGRYYVDAIRSGFTGHTKVYTGKSIAAYEMDHRINELSLVLTQYEDILRFNKLSDGYLVIHPEDENVIGDVRYSMLPNDIKPLWGIRLNPENFHQHSTEALFRKSDAETRQKFISLLKGETL